MIPPINTIPAPQLNSPTSITQPQVSSSTKSRIAPWQNASSSWKNQTPVNSPDLKSTPKLRIAQSELPGSSPQAPPSPSIQDTGSGYPTRIPQNYFGPAIGFGNGASYFGIISRFPFSENYSIRPSAVFGSDGTILRVPVTYDFNAGGGVQFSSGGGTVQGDKFSLLGTVGVDVNLFEGIALVGSYNTNFDNVSGGLVGLGFEF
jgi:hypothetical protein